MYAEMYRRQREITGLGHTSWVTAAPAGGPTPPETLESFEEVSPLGALLDMATTEDERELVGALEGLVDEMWRLGSAKAARGELRAAFMSAGRSKERYYRALCALGGMRAAMAGGMTERMCM